jgi:cytochrome c-type biogenesis protein CcmF
LFFLFANGSFATGTKLVGNCYKGKVLKSVLSYSAMLIESGHYFLVFSAFLILTQSSFFFALSLVTLTLSLFCLFISYACSDFSVMNVFLNSNHQLPAFYKISGAWSNHEGSMLLWAWICCVFCIIFLLRSRLSARTPALKPLSLIVFYFCLFLLATSNPYLRSEAILPEAMAELNPVLQDPVLAIHPPLIYAGYAASAIGFAVCLCICTQKECNILNGVGGTNKVGRDSPRNKVGRDSARKWGANEMGGDSPTIAPPESPTKEIRLWTLICWCFLTIGILLGSWWAYHELGWGGWWFWDPVENASFMPWVLSTGLLHSVLHTRLKHWTVFFSFTIFLLSLLGTFFVRSGFLASVHSFASDSSRGLFFLIFLSILVIICSVVFYKSYGTTNAATNKTTNVQSGGRMNKVGRDSARKWGANEMGGDNPTIAPPKPHLSLTKIQSLFALIVCAVVLCGTAAPVFFSLIFERDVSAGAPFFNGTIIPISAALFMLCISAHFDSRSILNLLFVLIVFVFNTLLALYIGDLGAVDSVFFSIAFLLFHTLWWKGRTSMQLAHGGLCVFIAGIIFSNTYKSQATQMLQIGDVLSIDNTLLILRGIDQLYGPTFQSICANLFVQPGSVEDATNLVGGDSSTPLFPEKRFYYLQPDSSTTKVAVQTNGFSDVYALIGAGNFETGWYTTVIKLPFIACIWIGFFVSSLGGFASLYKQLKMPHLCWTPKPPEGAQRKERSFLNEVSSTKFPQRSFLNEVGGEPTKSGANEMGGDSPTIAPASGGPYPPPRPPQAPP